MEDEQRTKNEESEVSQGAKDRIEHGRRREAQTTKSLPPEQPPRGPLACLKNDTSRPIYVTLFGFLIFTRKNA